MPHQEGPGLVSTPVAQQYLHEKLNMADCCSVPTSSDTKPMAIRFVMHVQVTVDTCRELTVDSLSACTKQLQNVITT